MSYTCTYVTGKLSLFRTRFKAGTYERRHITFTTKAVVVYVHTLTTELMRIEIGDSSKKDDSNYEKTYFVVFCVFQ